MSAVDTILTQALAQAAKYSDVSTYANEAISASGSSFSLAYTPNIPNPVSVEPNLQAAPFAPNPNLWVWQQGNMQQFFSWLMDGSNPPINKLTNLVTQFMLTYFPIASDAYPDAVAWLKSAIVNGGTGIPAAIEDQIWQRARDRINSDNQSALDAAASDFAARGMPLPTGALATLAQELRFNGLQKNADLSRDVGIKQAEIEIENIRFAVDQAMKMRYQALQAATDYLRALMSSADLIAKTGGQLGNIQADLINASANFYNARLHRDQLLIESASEKAKLDVHVLDAGINQFRVQVEGQVNAAVAAMNAVGHTVQAALSALNTIGVETTAL